jgi:hypothetical protein
MNKYDFYLNSKAELARVYRVPKSRVTPVEYWSVNLRGWERSYTFPDRAGLTHLQPLAAEQVDAEIQVCIERAKQYATEA